MKTKGLKHTIVSNKLKKETARLEALSDEEFKEEREQAIAFKQEVYEEADKVILIYYNKLLVIHEKESNLLKKKEKWNKMRTGLIQIIGHEAFDKRVKAILPNRIFEI